MTRFLFPLFLIALGVFGLVEHDAIGAQLAAMYPNDPARQIALQHCFEDNHQFNRLNPVSRSFCYEKYLPEIAASQPLFMPTESEQTRLITVVASAARPPPPEIRVRLAEPAAPIPAPVDRHPPRSSPLAEFASSLVARSASAATLSNPPVTAAVAGQTAGGSPSPPLRPVEAKQTQLIPVVANDPPPPAPELRVQLAAAPKPAPPSPAQADSGPRRPPTQTSLTVSDDPSATVIAPQAANWPPVLAPLPSDIDR